MAAARWLRTVPVSAVPIGVRVVPIGYSAGLALLIAGPLLGPGYLLWRDAVATPRSYLTDSALGLGDTAPRAVPQDAAVAVLSVVLDGGWVVRLILVLALWLAGWGAARLVRELLSVGIGPQLVAATVAVWNPYVAERLLQGHWSLLTGYAALPWVALAAREASWFALLAASAAAGLTPTGGVLAAILAAVVVPLRRLPAIAAVAVGAAAPWLVASLFGGSAGIGDPAGVAAFAARAEPGLGTLGSLAGLGGIWNADAVPSSRTGGFALVGTVVLLGVVALGLPALWRTRDRTVRALLLSAGLAVLLPAAAATPLGLSTVEWMVRQVPGAGLFRDTQKWVALAVPGYTLAAAAGCRALAARTTSAAAVPLAGLVLLALPDLAWGVGNTMHPVRYPPGWSRVADAVRGDGAVAVLPAGMFRTFPGVPVPVLDPAPRMVRADVLQTGDLPVGGTVVAGEGAWARQVQRLLTAGADPARLADLGVGWVLVERTSGGALGAAQRTVDRLPVVYADADLALYAVGTPRVQRPPPAQRAGVVAAHLLWAGIGVGGLLGASGLLGAVVGAIRRRDQP
ncbi:hypothetical protein [Skermania piniformis]|uniref:Transmembrane protein n=1 Tax=Skermania pinensis TaxID=39122 RepID=A0ABX8SFW5_9ACTN|nr:hypothetical protein [Skermania piniformis]QXQ16062.1 hypothetical protein KV203_18640 [Skermania piniformis]